VGPLLGLLAAILVPSPAFNDFNSYWLAGGLVDRGISPYDLGAMATLGELHGRSFVLGTGYSYPLPFAVAMVPLSRLPFGVALAVFETISLVAFAWTVASWLSWMAAWTGAGTAAAKRLRIAALLAGAFPPVIGTVEAGQVNLIVLAVLAAGVRRLLDASPGTQAGGAVLVGLASIVKLVPAAILVPLLLARRWAESLAMLASGVVVLGLASWAAPASLGGTDRLLDLIAPDPFFTNVSINGFVSRLVLATDRSAAVVPHAFDPGVATAVVTAGFALATLAILWRARSRLQEPRALALAIGFALLAATIGGPKNSYWNVSLALVTVGLFVAAEAPWLLAAGGDADRTLRSRFRDRFDRIDRWLLAGGFLGIAAQTLVWVVPPPSPSIGLAPLLTLVGSGALYGMLCLWTLTARRLVARAPQAVSSAALS
jgi:alpha-1,2-mannosyltransferase